MAEVLTFHGQDGSSLVLNDHVTCLLRARRGFNAPPVQLFSERIPGAHGARYTGTVVRERLLSWIMEVNPVGLGLPLDFVGAERAEHEVCQRLAQNGYLESVANGVARRLDVHYAGGLEDTDTGRRRGDFPVLAPEYRALAPYWYDPTEQSYPLPLATAPTGVALPLVLPAFFGVAGQSARVTLLAGDAPGPWRVEVLGPLTRLQLAQLTPATGAQLELSYSVPAGALVRLDTALGQRRVLLDTPSGITNISHGLSAASEYFELAAGDNVLSVQVTGGNNANLITFRWTRFYLGHTQAA